MSKQQVKGLPKTALYLVAAGLAFAFLHFTVAGVDIFIDAVGYLIAFNGVRALRKATGRFAGCDVLCMALVAAGILGLFFTDGTVGLVVGLLHYALLLVFVCLLMAGFLPYSHQNGRKKAGQLNFAILLFFPAALVMYVLAGFSLAPMQTALWVWRAARVAIPGHLLYTAIVSGV